MTVILRCKPRNTTSSLYSPSSAVSSYLVSTMSWAPKDFVTKAQALENASDEFTASAREGDRIIPSPSKDTDFQPTPALRDWAGKKSTHDKCAIPSFDTGAADKEAEYASVLAALESAAKRNLG